MRPWGGLGLTASANPDMTSADELGECPVCFSLPIDPIRLGCSHSFCRLCLLKSTRLAPDGRSCPLCRALLDINVKEQAADAILERAVRAAVGDDAYEQQLATNVEEIEELVRVADATLPIFYMFPGPQVGDPVGLHFFEPRYRILIRRSWEGNKIFVYCPGRPLEGARAVLVHVDRAAFLPDGRANIVGRAIEEVTLGETWVEDGTAGLYYTKVTAAATLVAGEAARASNGGRTDAQDEESPAAGAGAAGAAKCCLLM